MPDITAVAIYDYNANDETEMSFKVGNKIKVIAQDPDGWWVGERVDNGKVGKFPGSYVQIEVKSKKEQFKEEYESVRQLIL